MQLLQQQLKRNKCLKQPVIQLKEVFDLVIEQGKFNHVIDPFGDTNLFKLLDLININGKYITCGMSDQTSPGAVSVNLSSEIGKLIVSNISIMGNCLGSSAHLENAIEDFRNGNLDVIINDVISDDIDTFMFKSFLDKTKIGKVVFDYGSTAKQAI